MRREPVGYIAGTWKATCDRCGFNYRNTQLRLEWTGLRVCHDCFDERHPQDLIVARPDRQAPPWVRPEPVLSFVVTALQDDDGIMITIEDGQPILV